MEEDVDGLPVLGLLVDRLLAQPKQAGAGQGQELLRMKRRVTSTLLSVHFILKVLSSEIERGRKLGSSDRYWFSIMVLAIILFVYFKDIILDSTKNVLPLVQPEKLKFFTNTKSCCKSHVAHFNCFSTLSAL